MAVSLLALCSSQRRACAAEPSQPQPANLGASATEARYPIDLPAVLRLAGAQNLDVQIARERLAEARAERQIALWQFFPWLEPGVAYRRHDNLIQDVAGNVIDVHKEAYAVGPTLVGQVDLGEAIYRKLAAEQLVKAAAFGFEAQQQDTVVAAAQGYFDLLQAQAAVHVAEMAIDISTNYASQVRRAAEVGIAFRGDVFRVDVQTERHRLTLRQAQERSDSAGARLAQLLHLRPDKLFAPEEKDFVPLRLASTNAVLDKLVAEALATRPELKETQARLAAARAAREGAVYGPLVPTLSAQVFAGGFGGNASDVPNRFGEAEDYFVALGWRIGPGGLFDQGRRHLTESRVRTAALGTEKIKDEVIRQVVEALARVQSMADQYAAATRAVQLAQEGLRLTHERKEFAVGAVLEDIQAQQDLTQTRLDLVNALAEYNKAQYALQGAVGALR